MLRNRIFLGVTPLIVLLIAVGGYAVWLFLRLGGAVNSTLHENYISIAAMRDLTDSALRIDRALSFHHAGGTSSASARAELDREAAICRRNVDAELKIITEPGEAAAATVLRQRDEAFLNAAAAALNADSLTSLAQPLADLTDAAQAVQRINEQAMNQKDQRARDTADTSTRVMVLAMIAAVLIGLLFAYRLSSMVLRPIRTLTASARELGEGNLDQVLPVESRDELGQLANAFNKMAGKLRLYRQSTADEILEARQASEATFAALPDPIIIFSGEGQIVYQNNAAERLRKKLNGSEANLPIVPLAMEVLGGGGDYLPDTFDKAVCVRVDDRERFLLPRVIGFRDSRGAVVILQDVTRFRLLDDVKTNLVATVSHELKTPLTSIRMAVHLLLEERIGALNPKQTELMIATRDDAERLLDLINSLLDLARLESGAAISERVTMRPEELVRRAAEDARELLAARGLRIATQSDADLPPVLVSPDQLSHVFSNLISNAGKHSPAGEEILLTARRQSPEGAVRFSIIDRGSGVPPAQRERIFEKFYRVPGEPREGAGLGLAICKEIVKAHDGRIGVTGAPDGRGSEFFFVLPPQVSAALQHAAAID
jgi:signal transduction histidine kinase